MVNVTLSVPEELKNRMDRFKIINWSEVAREAFIKKMGQLEILESFSKESELTEKDALRLGREVNKTLAKRYGLLKEPKLLSLFIDEIMKGSSQVSKSELVRFGREVKKGRFGRLKKFEL